MRLEELTKRAVRLIGDNSPVILTTIGVTGTITTALFTGRASFKAAEILAAEEATRTKPLEIKEKVSLTWKLYIPAVGTGVLTVACIIVANRIGMRRAAAMAAAYSVSERAFSEYKDKVIERMGPRKEQQVRDDLAQDRVNSNPVSSREVILTGTGDVLCYESITGRYFQSNVETLRRAQNDINFQILHDMVASLTDLYNIIGLPATKYSDEIGWNADTLLEMKFSTTLADDGRPCISLEYQAYPIRDYCRIQ